MKRERERARVHRSARVRARVRVRRPNFPSFPLPTVPSLFFPFLAVRRIRIPLSDVSTPQPTIDHTPTFVTRFRQRPKTIAVINLNGFFRRPNSTQPPSSPPPAVAAGDQRVRIASPPPSAGTFDLARKNRGLATALVNPSRARRFGSDWNATS